MSISNHHSAYERGRPTVLAKGWLWVPGGEGPPIPGAEQASAAPDTDRKTTQSGKLCASVERKQRGKRFSSIKAMARHANEAPTNRSCAKGWSFAAHRTRRPSGKDPAATKGRHQLRLPSADPGAEPRREREAVRQPSSSSPLGLKSDRAEITSSVARWPRNRRQLYSGGDRVGERNCPCGSET